MGTTARRRFASVLLAALLLGLAPSANASAGYQFRETFDSPTWYEQWGLDTAPWHTTRITEGDHGPYLSISFAALSFNGSSWALPTGTADTVTLRYRLRFGPTWDPMAGQSGKLAGFGLPRRNPSGTCAEACGLKPVTGPYYSARGSFDQDNTGGSYVYTPPCTTAPGLTARNERWDAAPFANDTWYVVQQRITMNTPGLADGRIQAWVDGKLVYDSGPTFCFRSATSPQVHVGTAWFEFYYGGKTPPPTPMWLDIDDISVAY